MGSDVQCLPAIILNELNSTPGSRCWKSTSGYVRWALETYGCLVLTTSTTTDEVFMLSEELFGLTADIKAKHTSQIAGFGYGGNYSTMPLFEYFGIEDGHTVEAAQEFLSLMWPHAHHALCESLHSYCKLLLELHKTVMKMVLTSYGLDDFHHPLSEESSFYMTRIMKYHAPGETRAGIGLVPHRDKSFMAVIGTNEVEGLEIETPNGEWINFEPSPHRFIVIVGEALMAWSNGRVYCPLHRVTTRGIRDKYSVALFSFVKGVLEVPKELVDDEHPLKFKAFSNMEFLEYCREGGQTMAGAIHTYCGI